MIMLMLADRSGDPLTRAGENAQPIGLGGKMIRGIGRFA